jgi:hypothetical protein
MTYKKIEDLIVRLSSDPYNPEINFECAVEYEKLNQSASAVSFYLRAAEYGYGTHRTITYNSLLKIARCFDNQSDRVWNVSNYILHAVAYEPDRPEAYFMMSQFHEKKKDWQEAYTWAEMGLSKKEYDHLPADIGYYGKYCLEFEKAVSGWWIGRSTESNFILNKLKDLYIKEEYKNAIKYNLERT